MDRMLKPKETAELLGVSTATLANWRALERGPQYVKMSNSLIRYRESAVQQYLQDRTIAGKPDQEGR